MRQPIRMGAALAAAFLVCGCGTGGSGEAGSGGPKFDSLAVFDPVPISPADSASIPFPFDGLFAGFTDPTLNIPNADDISFVAAANELDGFSTTASIFCDVLGFIDFSTLADGLLVIDGATGQRLTPGVDYTVQPSPALAVVPGTNPPIEAPIEFQRSRILIEPLKPLAPSTTYLVALKTSVRNSDGRHVIPSATFRVVRSATPVAQQVDAYLAFFDATQLATLEALRAGAIRPVVEAVMQIAQLQEDDIALAWSFTTESIDNSLQAIEAQAGATIAADPGAQHLIVKDTGLDLAHANPLLPPIAEVYAGQIALPYFLATSGGDPHSTAPLTSFWHADPTKPDIAKSFLGKVPCGAFVQPPAGTNFHPSVSTTLCFPVPVKTTDVVVPVLMTVPNANSGHAQMPEGGWPVVVFQHGVTRNRSDMLALAPALSLAGFAVIAIDLPLHGITPADPAAILRNPATPERTFDLDLQNNTTSAPGPDGTVDASGVWFINLASLLTSRDNLRQAESDLIYLTKSLPAALVLGGNSLPNGVKLDGSQRRFVGHSLGGIVGGAFLGVNTDVDAATLAMPGGGVAKLLDASKTFGPIVAGGLAANGVIEGTDDYETFERFAQQLVDSGDPINYAEAAGTAHPIHMIEVVGDLVVPNAAPSNPGTATLDKVTITGFLSGTDPLAEIMRLSVQGPLDVPITTPNVLLGPAARNNVVVFNQGDHGSILSPATSPAATQEMQRETANFLASDGLCLPLGGNCPEAQP